MLLALPRLVIEKDPDAAIEIFYVVAYTAVDLVHPASARASPRRGVFKAFK